MPILEVRQLVKRYKETVAVDGISFSVGKGEIVGLLGPNGAGKTTTINMILGVLEPTAGSVVIDGIDIANDRSRALLRTNFAAVYSQIPGNLTLRQNLIFFSYMYDVRNIHARIDEVMEEFDVAKFADTRAGLLSSGEQTRASLAKAMLNKPSLLLLDEPTASIDPSTARALREKIRAITTETNCGVLWTSHNMHEVETVCDRVLFLSHGSVLLEGDPKVLPSQYKVGNLEELFIKVAREPLSLELE